MDHSIVLGPTSKLHVSGWIAAAAALWVVVMGSACGGNYCQSGAKHGTQCYDVPSNGDPPLESSSSRDPQTEPRADPQAERTLPATAPR